MSEDEESGSGGAGWLVSFADLMTLLFAAFVVLYGLINQGTSDTSIGIVSTIREAFVEVSDEIPDREEYGIPKEGKFNFRAHYGSTFPKDGAKKAVIKQDPRVAFDNDKNKVESLLDEFAQEGERDKGLREAMKLGVGETGAVIQLMGAYFFAEGRYKFHSKGKKRFLRLGKILKKAALPMLIEGHAGKVHGQGLYSANDIAALRAAYAASLLTEELGMDPLEMTTVSFGDRHPLALDSDAKGRHKNRRIEIKVFRK